MEFIVVSPTAWHGRLIRLIRSPRAILGGLVALDLTRIFDLFASVPDWLVPAVSVGVGILASDIVGMALTVAIVSGAFYVFAPRLYQSTQAVPREALGFRMIVTLGSLVLFVFFYTTMRITYSNSQTWRFPSSVLGSSARLPAVWSAVLGLVLLVLFGSALMWYLVARHQWTLFDPDGPAVQLLDDVMPFSDMREEAAEELPRDGYVGVFNRVTWRVGVALVLGIPLAVAGMLASTLYLAEPLPDLLLLTWVTAGVIAPVVPRVRQPAGGDLEERLYGAVKNSTRSLNGMMTTIFAVGGVFFAVLPFAIALAVVPAVITGMSTAMTVDGDAPVHVAMNLSVLGGLWLIFLSGGLYSIWYWLRIFKRLPAFLSSWEGTSSSKDIPARPPGLTVPPVILLLGVGGYLVYLADAFGGTGTEAPVWVVLPLAVGWPLVLGCLAIPVWLTQHRSSQDITSEDHVVVGSFTIQALGLWMFSVLGTRVLDETSVGLTGPIIIVLVVSTSLIPNVYRYQQSGAAGTRRYSLAAYFIVLLGIFGGLTLFAPSWLDGILFLLAGVSGLAALALTWATYTEKTKVG